MSSTRTIIVSVIAAAVLGSIVYLAMRTPEVHAQAHDLRDQARDLGKDAASGARDLGKDAASGVRDGYEATKDAVK